MSELNVPYDGSPISDGTPAFLRDAQPQFTRVANAFWERGWALELKPHDLAVYLYLKYRAGGDGRTFPGMTTIATATSMSRRQVVRAIEHLERIGLIQVQRRRADSKRNLANLYLIADLDRMPGPAPETGSQSLGSDSQSLGGGDSQSLPSDSQSPDLDSLTHQERMSTFSPERGAGKRPDQELFEAIWETWNGRTWKNGTKVPANQRAKINHAVKQCLETQITPAEWRQHAAEYRRQHPTWEFTPQAVLSHWSTLEPGETPSPYRDAGEILAEEEAAFEQERAQLQQRVRDIFDGKKL